MDADILANLVRRHPMQKLKSGVIRTCPVRLAFTKKLVTPDKTEKGKDRWRCSLLFPHGAALTPLVEDLKAAAIAKFGDKALQMIAAGKISYAIKEQSECLTDEMEPYPGFSNEKGAKYIDVSTTIAPGFRDAQVRQCEASTFYAGSWALVTISVYANEYTDPKTNTTNRYLGVNLHNMQFLADDDRLGGGGYQTDADEEFEKLDASASPADAFNGAANPAETNFDFG